MVLGTKRMQVFPWYSLMALAMVARSLSSADGRKGLFWAEHAVLGSDVGHAYQACLMRLLIRTVCFIWIIQVPAQILYELRSELSDNMLISLLWDMDRSVICCGIQWKAWRILIGDIEYFTNFIPYTYLLKTHRMSERLHTEWCRWATSCARQSWRFWSLESGERNVVKEFWF